ncbi:MAG TPA: thioesterase family protein [Aggregatilineales bacterium]|nr:thioesterase family protein [Aggregatilineales bacterium]
MKPAPISLEQLATLPPVYRLTIPPDYRDRMNHMNIRWYLALYDEAGDEMYKLWGEDPDYYARSGNGGFDLEHHIHYLNEVLIGDVVAVRARLLARTPKRLHYLMFMVNETRGNLASIFECVHAHADLQVRRTSPYPPELAARLDAILAEHAQITWPAPVCGSMNA